MTLCQTLFGQEQEWRKHSVYPLRDDTDRDFEFYVLVPGQGRQRPLFLKVLEQAIANPSAKLEGDPLSQFSEWTGIDNGSIASAINWIKIAIEQYPMRLFVVRNEIPNQNLHPFLKKRICWIKRSEFEKRLNGDKEQFKLWLHAQWVKHLIRNVTKLLSENETAELFFVFPMDDQRDTFYYPGTLPERLATATRAAQGAAAMDLHLDRLDVKGFQQEIEVSPTANLLLWFTRHHCFWEKPRGSSWRITTEYETWAKNHTHPIYSENLSGALSYWGRLVRAFEHPNSPSSISFLLLLAETALLRVGIVDERFQEWWNNRDEERVGFLIQQRLISLFWEQPGEYNQPSPPHHKVLAQYEPPKGPDSGSLKWEFPNQPAGVDNLWKEHQRGIDVIIVHQGILDKWKPDHAAQHYTKDVLNWKEEFPFVVITSGRGRPENVPFGVRFPPFSGVEASMVGDRFEKLTLLRQVAIITKGRE